MLFHVKSFQDCNVILKVIVTNYVPMLLRTVENIKELFFNSPQTAYYLLELNQNTLKYYYTNKVSEKV